LLFEHFQRWLEIFKECVDETFAGERADFLKLRAGMIANRMLGFVSQTPSEYLHERNICAEAGG
jgi:hypothetical protein